MINKIKYIAISLTFISLLSCKEEFEEISSSVITNDKIATDQKTYDVSMTLKDIAKVQTDNINSTVSEYLLGSYNPGNCKNISASIISNLRYPGSIKTEQSSTDDINAYGAEKNIDSTYTLDKVILKIPYASRDENGKFNVDEILGNSSETTSLKVLLNNTYLNALDPSNPAKKNSYFSDEYASFQEGDELTAANFDFSPKEGDSSFEFQRTNSFDSTTFKDVIKIKEKSSDTASKLFLAIPLDMTKMKSLVWDKLNQPEFDSKVAFNDYLKGIIIKSVGSEGNILSLDMLKGKPSIEFYYTITRVEGGNFVDTLNKAYSIALGDIHVNTFETSASVSAPANNVTVQGTSGNEIDLKILTANQLEELKNEKILINDAVLTFYVNKTIHTETKTVPERLLLYKQVVKDGINTSEHIFNSASKFSVYDGFLKEKDSKPHVYTLRITEYIKNLIKGNQENTVLKLKVMNKATDLIIYKSNDNIKLDNTFKFYNSNPRGVTLYDGSIANGDNRAQLKISYSKEK